jgi:hypothetical protein
MQEPPDEQPTPQEVAALERLHLELDAPLLRLIRRRYGSVKPVVVDGRLIEVVESRGYKDFKLVE